MKQGTDGVGLRWMERRGGCEREEVCWTKGGGKYSFWLALCSGWVDVTEGEIFKVRLFVS